LDQRAAAATASTMRRGIADRGLKSRRFEVITPTLRRAWDRPAEMPL
jgi:hypothetical protein